MLQESNRIGMRLIDQQAEMDMIQCSKNLEHISAVLLEKESMVSFLRENITKLTTDLNDQKK